MVFTKNSPAEDLAINGSISKYNYFILINYTSKLIIYFASFLIPPILNIFVLHTLHVP